MASYKITNKLVSWASDIEQETIQQAARTSRLDIVHGHVALMPDAHVGIGSTVGSVIPTKGAVIPAAIGVDIGCGMIANKLNLNASDLPDNLDQFLSRVERAIPAGVGKGHGIVSARAQEFLAVNRDHSELTHKQEKTALEQFGSLGSGNHFFEICLDQNDDVWFVLHSGSRGIGNQLAKVHIDGAKKLAKELHVALEDKDLAYFLQGTPEFQAYINDMLWAQHYALVNRTVMMKNVLDEFWAFHRWFVVMENINCHHNFTQQEVHNGEELWITRKGAIKADVGDRGIIPGSMGAKSYIVKGLGNPLSYNSCSHGAGRRLSRSAAKKAFTEQDLHDAMLGTIWNSDKATHLIDEIPSSYKDIDQVMEDQKDLVEVEYELRQILNYKGTN